MNKRIFWRKKKHRNEIQDVPNTQGVYKLYWIYNDGRKTIKVLQYIGQTKNLSARLHQHLEHRWWNYAEYAVTTGFNRDKRLALEKRLLQRWKPPYNVQF